MIGIDRALIISVILSLPKNLYQSNKNIIMDRILNEKAGWVILTVENHYFEIFVKLI